MTVADRPTPIVRRLPTVDRRTAVVVGPLLVLLVLSGVTGAWMMTAPVTDAASTDSSAQAPARCWDGSPATGGCPEVSGVTGVAWVFPTLDPEAPGCVDLLERRPDFRRPVMWQCDQRLAGPEVTLTYSQLSSTASALRYLERSLGTAPRRRPARDGAPERYESSGRTTTGFTVTAMYAHQPFAVSVVAPTRAARDAAYAALELRDADAVAAGRE